MPPYPLAFARVLAKERVSVGREAILTRGCDAQYSQAPQLLPELLSREQSGASFKAAVSHRWPGQQDQVIQRKELYT